MSIEVQDEVLSVIDGGLYDFVGYYSVNDLATVQEGGNLLFTFSYDSLPDSNYVFNAKDVDYDVNDYYWYGDHYSVGDEGHINAYFLHISKFESDKFVLSLNINGYTFKGISVNEGVIAFFRYNEYLLDEPYHAHDSVPYDSLDYPPMSYVAMKNCINNCPVDVLILYTQEAKVKESTIEYLIRSEFRQAQTVLSNSRVNECHVKLNLVGIEANFNFPKSSYNYDKHGGPDQTLKQLYNFNVGNIQGLRAQYGADIVILIDDDEILNIDGISEGYSATQVLNKDMMYVLMGVSNLSSGEYSLAHHLGHMFSTHHWENGTYNSGYYFGYHVDISKFTVMQYKQTGFPAILYKRQRVPFFSNQYVDLYYGGPKTGDADNSAAFAFINEGCVVANMIDPIVPDPFYAYIDGDNIACPCMNTMLDVVVSGAPVGTGVISYEWFTSTDGINYSGVVSTAANYFAQAPCTPNTVRFIKVRVTAGGMVDEATGTIKSQTSVGGYPCALKKEPTGIQELLNADELGVFPNPGKSHVTLYSAKDLQKGTMAYIYTADGKLWKSKKVTQAGNELTLDVSEIPSGICLIKVHMPNGTSENIKFIKM